MLLGDRFPPIAVLFAAAALEPIDIEQTFLVNVRCNLFDDSGNFFRPGDVDRVAGAANFELVAVAGVD